MRLLTLALLLFSAVGLSLLQIVLAEDPFSGFSVLGETVNGQLASVYLQAALFIVIGFLLGIPVLGRQQRATFQLRNQVIQNDLRVIVMVNFLVIAVSQYFMGSAGVLGILSGTVTAQDIEAALDSSPFGIHGIKLLCGYLSIVVHRAAYSMKGAGILKALLVLQAIFIFLSSAKMGGMLFFVASILTLQRGQTLGLAMKAGGAIAILLAIFVVTRIIRNPDMQIGDIGAFLMTFVLGLYFGSPVVNTNYVMAHPAAGGNIIFIISHLIPQKLLPTTLKEAMVNFPDPTSPLGLIGAAYAAYSVAGVALACIFAGFMVGKLAPGREDSPVKNLFLPFLLVASGFAIMYHHFFNLNFFWMPLLMSWVASTRYFSKTEECV